MMPWPVRPFGDHADDKAEHGGAAIEALNVFELLHVDLSGGGVLEPLAVGWKCWSCSYLEVRLGPIVTPCKRILTMPARALARLAFGDLD